MISIGYLFEFSQDRTKPVMLRQKSAAADTMSRAGGVDFWERNKKAKESKYLGHLSNYVSSRQSGNTDQADTHLKLAHMYRKEAKKYTPNYDIPNYRQITSGVRV